jgi:hypothetical protein
MVVDSYGGTVRLLTNDLTLSNGFLLTRGTFDLNGKTLTVNSNFSSSNTNVRVLQDTAGGGKIIANSRIGTVFDMTDPTNLTVSNAPDVTLSGALTGAVTFAGGNKTFGDFWNHTTNAYATTITGSNIFNDFKVDAGRTQYFTNGTTQTVNAFNAVGTGVSGITLGSTTTAPFFLTKAGGGRISSNYISVSYSTVTPATNTWYAGVNSTNGNNNSGWIFSTNPTDPPTKTMRGTLKARGTVKMR